MKNTSPSVPSISTSIKTSLCPPPPELTASNGFQPTNAAANTFRRAMKAASSVAAIAASAAADRKTKATASAEPCVARSTPTESAVKAGP